MEKPTDTGTEILHLLRETPYTCSSVKEVCGGLASVLYRGKLSQPLSDGTDSVVIKHSEETCPKAPHLSLSTNRCAFMQRTEQEILTAIQASPAARVSHKDVVVQCPRVHHYIPHAGTQILQDFPHESTLHEWLSSTGATRDATKLAALGEALGTWLMRFHVWSESAAGRLSGVVLANTNSTGKDLGRTKLQSVERHILIQPSSSSNSERSPGCSLAIINWETSCYDHFTRDVANMIAGLYMQKHFSGSDSALIVLQGFVANYSALSEEEAYRAVAQVGENFFHWTAYAPETGTEEQVREIVELGEALITMGMEEDRNGVMGTFLRCLLKLNV
ncbi:hypothetical protein BJX65DRAFT_303774 [Aspergillus insuetus]